MEGHAVRTAFRRLGRWAVYRFSEKSTWAGIGLLTAAHGHDMPQAVMDALSFWGPFLGTALITMTTTPKE